MLPQDSLFRADQALNFDLAESIINSEERMTALEELEKSGVDDSAGKTIRTSAGFTREVAALADIYDAVQSLRTTLISVNLPKGKNPPRQEPYPRPVSALDVLRDRRDAIEVDAELARLGVL